jgi:AcrR family transcriptional regulator
MAGTGVRARTRVTKHPDVRRDELLHIALQLCRSDGFEAMSVEQVTRVAGVAKGTFYHYFASKDAMLEELVSRFGEALFDYLSAAADAPGTGAERIRALMAAAGGYKLAQSDITYATFLYASGNLALRHRLFAAWRERAREVLLPAIQAGQADGSLSVTSAEATTDLILLLWFEAADQLWMRALAADGVEGFVDVMVSGAAAIYEAHERLLGLPDGAFSIPLDPQVTEMTRQLYHSLDRKQS